MSLSLRPPHNAPEPSGADLSAAMPRARGRPRKLPDQRDDGNRRSALVIAAAKLFRAKGFAATTTRDIARAVGMRSGSPFYHFEHKEALLEAVMQSGMERAIASQRALLASLLREEADTPPPAPSIPPTGLKTRRQPAARPHRMLQALVRHHFEVLLGPDSDFIPVMLYEWRSLPAAAQTRMKSMQAEYESDWLPALSDLHAAGALRGDLKLTRLLMFGALNWCAQWYRAEGESSLDRLTSEALHMWIHDGPAR